MARGGGGGAIAPKEKYTKYINFNLQLTQLISRRVSIFS